MKVSEFVTAVEPHAQWLRKEGRTKEAKRLVSQKSAFPAVLKFLRRVDMDLEEYQALKGSVHLAGDTDRERKIRSRYSNSLGMIKHYNATIGDEPSGTTAPNMVGPFLAASKRVMAASSKNKYRTPKVQRAYGTVFALVQSAYYTVKRLSDRFQQVAGEAEEDVMAMSIKDMLGHPAAASCTKGARAQIKRTVAMLSGRLDVNGVPVLQKTARAHPTPKEKEPELPPVHEDPPVPTKEDVEEQVVNRVVQLQGVAIAAVPVEELSTYDSELSLEKNYRQLHREYTLERGGRDRAEQKVRELASVVGALAQLTH